jgi:hypothetical protein
MTVQQLTDGSRIALAGPLQQFLGQRLFVHGSLPYLETFQSDRKSNRKNGGINQNSPQGLSCGGTRRHMRHQGLGKEACLNIGQASTSSNGASSPLFGLKLSASGEFLFDVPIFLKVS